MPLMHGCDEATISHNIAEMIKAGHPHDQAVAAAYAQCEDHQKSLGNTGAMIALYPDPQVASLLFANTVESGIGPGAQLQSPDDMHITLVYLAEDVSALADEEIALSEALQAYAATYPPISAMVNGIACFYTPQADGTMPLVATVDSASLPDLRQQLLAIMRGLDIEPVLEHGFIPHITLAYVPEEATLPRFQPLPDLFLKLSLVLGDKRIDFPFEMPQPMQKRISVYKQANGLYRWDAISSNNIKDRDREIVRLKALQADVARTKLYGDDSHLRFFHIPYDIGGAPDYRTIVDGMLVESGEFYDEPVAKCFAEYINDHPEGLDGSGWKVSIGFLGAPDVDKSYHSAFIEERSALPGSYAANSITQFGMREKMKITAEQQKAIDAVLTDPVLKGIMMTAISAQQQSKAADAAGVVRKAAKEGVTPDVPVLTRGLNVATPQTAAGFVVTKAADDSDPDKDSDDDTDDTKNPDKKEDMPMHEKTVQGLSDDDLKGIAEYVQQVVTKAVSDAVAQIRSELKTVEKTLSVQAQTKMLNEVPKTTLDRLKAFGATAAAATPKTIKQFDPERGEMVDAPNPDYVEKGKNLPAEPGGMMELLGFGSQIQE